MKSDGEMYRMNLAADTAEQARLHAPAHELHTCFERADALWYNLRKTRPFLEEGICQGAERALSPGLCVLQQRGDLPSDQNKHGKVAKFDLKAAAVHSEKKSARVPICPEYKAHLGII